MNRDEIAALLNNYLKGETSAEENERIERWLEENGDPDPEWQKLGREDKDQWLSGVFNDIKATIHTQPKVIVLPSRKRLWRNVAAIAAVLIVLFTIYLQWPALQNRFYPAQLISLTVPADHKKMIVLADGSRVWVNSGSELKYAKVFNGKTRTVYLSGEAYFDIKHDDSKPFIIHTGNVVTTVLGTAFNIKEDKNKHTIEVTVTRGKVSVSNGNKTLGVLTPNQQISFNVLANNVVQTTVNAREVIAWQESEFYFEDITFGDAVLQLEEKFGVHIGFANEKLKHCRFTGTALTSEKLDKILNVICAFNNATYQTKKDGSILIDGPGCNQ